jgi:hypothetical protein
MAEKNRSKSMRDGSSEEFLPESGALKSRERTSGDQRNPEC